MKSYASTTMPKISYFPLPNSELVDIYLRKELPQETGSEGEVLIVYDEVYLRTNKSLTRSQVEENFEALFSQSEVEPLKGGMGFRALGGSSLSLSSLGEDFTTATVQRDVPPLDILLTKASLYFVANKSNTTFDFNDWTFYANELAYSDTDKFYPKFEGTYSDYNEVTSDDQTKYTWKIIKADDGIGIKSVKEYYAISTSNITPPSLQSDWSETPKTTDTTNKYLWNYEVYTYSNGDVKETAKRVIGTHGTTGATGATGKDGKGISSTTITYGLSTTDTVEPTNYTSNVPTLVKGQYLWTKTVWKYTDTTTETGYTKTYIAKDGNTGKDGIAGKDGVGIKSTSITYTGSTSGTVTPTSGWNTAVPTVASGSFLWTRTIWTYTDSTTETGYSVARMGVNGATGGKGDTGATGASATSYWLIASNNIIGKSQTGVINPTTITFKGFSKTGTANSVAYSGRFIIQTSTNGTSYTKRYESSANQNAYTYTIPADTKFIKALLYQAGGTSVLLDEQTVPVVESAEGLEIGQRNYVLNSEVGTDRLADASWSDAYMYLSDGIRGLVGEFELGFDVTLDAGVVGNRNIDFTIQIKGGGLRTFTIFPYKVITLTPGVTTHLSSIFTGDFTAFTSGGGRIPVKFGGAPDAFLHVEKLYIKKGNKATDWTPAPEDARTYKAWANSADGKLDFTRIKPNENLIIRKDEIVGKYVGAGGTLVNMAGHSTMNDFIPVTAGKTIHLSKRDVTVDQYFRCVFFNSSGVAVERIPNNSNSFSLTPPAGAVNLRVSYPTDSFPKIEEGNQATVYTTNPQDSLSGSIPKYVGFSPLDSENPTEFEWIVNPEYTQALADESLAGKVDNDAEYENLKNMAQEVKESYENFVSEGGEYQTEHSKLLDRTTAIEIDLGEYRQQINFVDTYMSVGNEGLIIGVKDSEGNPDANAMQMLLSNKSLSFMDGGEVVAYFSGQSFHINRGAIVESLQVGQHKITNLGNGHTVFQYTG